MTRPLPLLPTLLPSRLPALLPTLLLAAAAAASAQTSPWYVGAAQTFTHESNLYRLADGAPTPAGLSKSDLVSSTALLAGLDQPIGRQRLYGSATLRANRFADNQDLNNEGYALRAGLGWETVNRLSGTLEASAERSLARFDTDTEIGLQTTRNIEDNTRLFAEARLGVVTAYTAEVSLEHRERRFSSSAYDRRENRQTTATAGLRWRPLAGTTLGVGLRHTDGRYPRFLALESGGFEADRYTRDGLDLVGGWESGGATRLDARVTLGRTRYDRNDARDTSGATGFVAGTWRPGGRLSLTARLARDVGQDAYFSGNPFIDGLVDTSRTTTTTRVAADYGLSAKLRLRAALSHARRDLVQTLPPSAFFPGDVRGNDDTTELSLGATWEPTRSLVFGCDLGREKRSASGDLSLPYGNNRASCYGQVFLR